MAGKLERIMYRALYRVARKFDRNPQAKSLIHRSKNGTESPGISFIYYEEIMNKLLGRRNLFLPPHLMSFRQLLNEETRKTGGVDNSTKTDAAIALIRRLSSVWRSYESIFDQQSSNLVSSSSKKKSNLPSKDFVRFQEKNDIHPGYILVAHPLVAGPLHRSVILILDHSEKGTYGVVINRPTSHTLDESVKNLPQEMISKFGHANVAFGGMVRRMQFFHTFPTLGGNPIPFCQSKLFAGGHVTKALQLLKTNPDHLSEFQFFVGCCCWKPQQLIEEIDAGYWIVAESEPDKLMALLKSNTPITTNNATNSTVTTTSIDENKNSTGTVKKYRNGLEVERNVDVYQYAVESLGKKYEVFTRIPHWVDSTVVESCDMY
jgi:putative transcriptional regulator